MFYSALTFPKTFYFTSRHAHLAFGRQKAIVEGGTRMSVKMGRYPMGREGVLCSSRSRTAPLMSLDTSPRISRSTDMCSSLKESKNLINVTVYSSPNATFEFPVVKLSKLPDIRVFRCKTRHFQREHARVIELNKISKDWK